MVNCCTTNGKWWRVQVLQQVSSLQQSVQPGSNDGPSHVSKYRRQNAFVVEHVSHPGLTGPDPHAVSPATDTAATVDVPDTVPDTQPTFEETCAYDDDWTLVD